MSLNNLEENEALLENEYRILDEDRNGLGTTRTRDNAKIDSHHWTMFPGLFLGAALANIDVAYNLSSYTFAGSEFHKLDYVVWLILIHQIVHTVAHPIYGRISDRFGRKRVLLFAYIIFALGALMCGTALAFWQLLIGRTFLSLGVSGMTVMVTYVLTDILTIRQFALLQAMHSICETVGLVIGNTLGQQLAVSYGWRSVYRFEVVAALSPLVLVAFTLPRSLKPAPSEDGTGPETEATQSVPTTGSQSLNSHFDFLGTLLLISMILFLVVALQFGGRGIPWSHPLMITMMVASILSAGAFVVTELSYSEKPLVPLGILKMPSVLGSISCNLLTTSAYSMSIYLVSFDLQVTLKSGLDTSGGGLSYLYVGLGLGFLTAGYFVRKTGQAGLLTIGTTALSALCYLLICTKALAIEKAKDQWLLLFLGISIAGTFTGLVVTLISKCESKDRVILIAMSQVLVAIGSIVCTQIISIILQSAASKDLHLKLGGENKDSLILEVLKSLDILQTLDPTTLEIVTRSLQEICNTMHKWVFGVSLLALLDAVVFNVQKFGPR